MFNSQALETAIGLTLLFFIVATGASSIVELWSRVVSKRAKNFETALGAMLAGTKKKGDPELVAALAAFKGTSVYESAVAATGKPLLRSPKGPSYLSAKAFADAVTEMLLDANGAIKNLEAPEALPPLLKKRLIPIVREARDDLTGIKAGLERWFDETMARAEGAYKRWATAFVLIAGLLIAVAANASAYDAAQRLWKDPVTRQAVTEAASGLTTADKAGDLTSVSKVTDKLKELSLPIGWDKDSRKVWRENKSPLDWTSTQWGMVGGWILTALAVMLGAPFWFGLLSSLVSLRSTGSKPPTAANDPSSATAIQASAIARSGSVPQPPTGVFDWKASLKSALGAAAVSGGGAPQA
jgi:hypothetical protein